MADYGTEQNLRLAQKMLEQQGEINTLRAELAEDRPTIDCRSPEGVTVGLIDGIITAARVVRARDLTHPAVIEALRDIADDEDVRALLAAPGAPEARNPADSPSGELPGSLPPATADGASDSNPEGNRWSCPRCGSDQWVAASLTGPVEYGGRAIKQCIPCGHYSNDPVKPEPTPDGGQ